VDVVFFYQCYVALCIVVEGEGFSVVFLYCYCLFLYSVVFLGYFGVEEAFPLGVGEMYGIFSEDFPESLTCGSTILCGGNVT